MIERIIEYSVRNRFQIVAAAIALAVWGVWAVYHTPVDAIPDLSENQLIVFTDWMGHSPQEIEDQVTYPLSSHLKGLAGVKAVRSSSQFNFSMINVIFDDKTDFYFARERVSERLANIQRVLPSGANAYLAPDATATGQIFWYTIEGPGHDLSELRSIQDWYVRYQLAGVPGVAEVASVGGHPQEYQVDVDPDQLRAYQITLGQLQTAIARSNKSVGGRVVEKAGAEYVIRSIGWIESIEDIENTVITQRDGVPIYVKNVASVQLGTAFRRGILEKNGREAVGGVVLMRYGENPRQVTQRIKDKIAALQPGLPEGVRIVPFYDRTPLIDGAIHTVTGVLKEAMLTATILILLILGHIGGGIVICITLPLAVLFAFILMQQLGVPSNIMSLSGLAISIGVLVDSSIVMVDSASHRLAHKFGGQRVRGDCKEEIIAACRLVGRPIFFSILIMLISFIPVFALSGMEGKMFRPLAWTKTLAMIGVAILAITLVPALLPTFLRGRIRREEDNWIVRSFVSVYRPMLSWLMDRPGLVVWMFVCILGVGWILAGKLGSEFMPPLDEGTLLDMATSVPRASVSEVADNLKARDALLRQFPEVSQVVGKAGRAETPTDPAPLEMFETMVQYEPRARWPKRHLQYDDALRQAEAVYNHLVAGGFLKSVDPADRESLVNEVAMAAVEKVDTVLRQMASDQLNLYRPALAKQLARAAMEELLDILTSQGAVLKLPQQRQLDTWTAELAKKYGAALAEQPLRYDIDQLGREVIGHLVEEGLMEDNPSQLALRPRLHQHLLWPLGELLGKPRPTLWGRVHEQVNSRRDELLKERVKKLNWELFDRAVSTLNKTCLQQYLHLAGERDLLLKRPAGKQLATARASLDRSFADSLLLWKKSKDDLLAEMDSAVRVPGWGNIWTKPIQNRVDMLATGARTMVAVKIFGDDLDQLQEVSHQVARLVRQVEGATDVSPDQIVGKPYIEIDIDREKAARYGINVGDIQDTIEVALGGKTLTTTIEARRRFPLRLRYARDFRADEEGIRRLLVTARGHTKTSEGEMAPAMQIPLAELAQVRVVEGPAVIRSEGGMLRSYVQCNVRGRDVVGFVQEAQATIADQVSLPAGVFIEWGGQYEHQARAKRTLMFIFPIVVLVIVILLYSTYRDVGDTLLMMLAIPGALAGGVFFQYLFGYNFSVAVWVGYIACFGMATETGVIMLVYLREAIAQRGGLEAIGSVAELRQTVMDGAVCRLRPKILTEATAIMGIAPMLWASGVGAEVIRPMAAPVLGGLLIADEVIDIFLPVLFFWIRRRRWEKIQKNRTSTTSSQQESTQTDQGVRRIDAPHTSLPSEGALSRRNRDVKEHH